MAPKPQPWIRQRYRVDVYRNGKYVTVATVELSGPREKKRDSLFAVLTPASQPKQA